MYTLVKNNIPLLYRLCTLMPQFIPLLTLLLVCMNEESPPEGGG